MSDDVQTKTAQAEIHIKHINRLVKEHTNEYGNIRASGSKAIFDYYLKIHPALQGTVLKHVKKLLNA